MHIRLASHLCARVHRVASVGLTVAFLGLFAPGAFAGIQAIPLSGSDATGYLALTGIQSEESSDCDPGDPARRFPGNSFGCKEYTFEYPYFWDAGSAVWTMIVAEPLSSSSAYAQDATETMEQIAGFTTDTDFADFDLGRIEYDDSLISKSGMEVIPPDQLNLSLAAASDFDPLPTSRNVNNEFGWRYQIEVSNVSGVGLTLEDGVPKSLDIAGDVEFNVMLLGSPALLLDWNFTGPGDTTPDPLVGVGAFSITGSRLRFDFEEIGEGNSAFGAFTGYHVRIGREGTVSALVSPAVPMTGWPSLFLLLALLLMMALWKMNRISRQVGLSL